MSDSLYVFQCCNCLKVNMFKQPTLDDVILQCWYCGVIQVLPDKKASVSLEKFNTLLMAKIGKEALPEDKIKITKDELG